MRYKVQTYLGYIDNERHIAALQALVIEGDRREATAEQLALREEASKAYLHSIMED